MKNSFKKVLKLVPLSLLLLTKALVINSQIQHEYLANDINTIDSFINVKNIRSNVVLISFGLDAITAIKTQEGMVVIDAGIATGITQRIRQAIENELHSNGFKYLINTHYHPDHYGGNSVFDEAEIVGHKNGLSEIADQWKDTTKAINRLTKIVSEYDLALQASELTKAEWTESITQKTRYSNALVDAQRGNEILEPDITFEDSLQIELGELKFEMIYFGKCHSNSDILIYIPELKILFTGDLVFKYGRPSIVYPQSDEKEKWIRAINWIEKRIPEIETVITGHGVILTTEDIKSFNQKIMEIGLN